MSSSLQKLTSLSTSIAKNTKILTDHLAAKGLEAPSFDIDGLIEFPVSSNEKIPWNAREELVRDTMELHDLVVGPKEGLRGLGWDVSVLLFLSLRVFLLGDRRRGSSLPSSLSVYLSRSRSVFSFILWIANLQQIVGQQSLSPGNLRFQSRRVCSC